MSEKQELTKEERIEKCKKRINSALKDVDKNKKIIIAPLIQTVAFSAVTMEDLSVIINKDGISVEYQNGENQKGTKQTEEVKTYIALQKNLTAAVKTLCDIAPEAKKTKSKLQSFLES